jgi:hypothetical protein
LIRAGTYTNKKQQKGLSVQFLDIQEAEKFSTGDPDMVDAVKQIVFDALATGKGQFGEKAKKEKKEKEVTPSKNPRAAKKTTAKADTSRTSSKAERAKARRAAAKATA